MVDYVTIIWGGEHDGWTLSLPRVENLGSVINTSASEFKPYVSPDGKYLFFSSIRKNKSEIFWVKSQIIDELKTKVLK